MPDTDYLLLNFALLSHELVGHSATCAERASFTVSHSDRTHMVTLPLADKPFSLLGPGYWCHCRISPTPFR